MSSEMKRILTLLACLTLWVPTAFALSPHQVAARLKKVHPGLPIMGIKQSPMAGFYQVDIGDGQTLYVSADAKHFLTGDLYAVDNQGFVNLSEEQRKVRRKKLIDAVPAKDMVIYSPPKDKVKATITVFTDVDCPYCRKFHQEVPTLNKMGIAVRYLAYPRTGIGTVSYRKMVYAWCSKDPRQALDDARDGVPLKPKTCPNPVAKEYALGNEVGVTGTPSLVYADGTMVPGYLPARVLAKQLGVLKD